MSNESLKKEPIPSTNLFLIVGIGASAGGLEAFKQLIKAIPVDSGMAYILFQYLDPSHESILGEFIVQFYEYLIGMFNVYRVMHSLKSVFSFPGPVIDC